MLGAVQLGLLAACIVLFVPMGMAGWHLSRNKMLFFSCALFITLAVGVHLIPYFPSISTLLSPSVSSQMGKSSLMNRDSCISFLHSIVYKDNVECLDGSGYNNSCKKSWEWRQSGQVAECEFQKLNRADAAVLLNGTWIVVAGDSQARLTMVSLLDLVVGPEKINRIRGDLFKRHSDFSIAVDEIGMKVDFFWAPYASNLTNVVVNLKENMTYPDVMIMGAGLWDMLHLNNTLEYGYSLRSLRSSLVNLLTSLSELDSNDGRVPGSMSIRPPHLFWLAMPTLINSLLNTEEKKEKLTDAMLEVYDAELIKSKLLQQSGGPVLKLDLHLLTDLCGPQCTADGMHYNGAVYGAVTQIMLNALLIESNQKSQ